MSVISKKKERNRKPRRSRRDVCRCDVVERGPNWLFIRVRAPACEPALADRLWDIARQHFTSRLVLELDAADPINEGLGAELRSLSERLREIGGAVRLCGLPPEVAEDVLDDADCSSLRHDASRHDAAVGDSVRITPPQPR